jgi:hypothetical protein
MLGAVLALATVRHARVAAQEVVPGGVRELVTTELEAGHWAMDAALRAEALGLLERPLPFRRTLSLELAAEVLAEAARAAQGRGHGLEELTQGWRRRFFREFGGLSGEGAVDAPVMLGLRAGGGVVNRSGRAAPGYGEVGAGRTGARPLDDGLVVAAEVEWVSAGTHLGLLVQPESRSDGGSLRYRRLDAVVGLGGWRLAVGRQPLGLGKTAASGLVLSGGVPLDRVELRTERPAILPGMLGFLGPVGAQAFVSRLGDEARHAREPYFWGGSLSIQPFARLGAAVHRAAMFGGNGWDEPLTVKTLVDMLIGRVANLGFENQIVSVEARYRLPTEGVLPLTAFLEWGAEDAAGGWWDVPGRVIGIETPAVPGAEGLALGAAYTAIAERCCGNSPWYRHAAFEGNWAAQDLPLGHPLGGEGSEWLAYGTLDRPERNFRVEGRLYRRDRSGQNLYVPGREESFGGAMSGSWWPRRHAEVEARVQVEAGSGWSEHELGIGTNLYF